MELKPSLFVWVGVLSANFTNEFSYEMVWILQIRGKFILKER